MGVMPLFETLHWGALLGDVDCIALFIFKKDFMELERVTIRLNVALRSSALNFTVHASNIKLCTAQSEIFMTLLVI